MVSAIALLPQLPDQARSNPTQSRMRTLPSLPAHRDCWCPRGEDGNTERHTYMIFEWQRHTCRKSATHCFCASPQA
jgi:hypothetical protein